MPTIEEALRNVRGVEDGEVISILHSTLRMNGLVSLEGRRLLGRSCGSMQTGTCQICLSD